MIYRLKKGIHKELTKNNHDKNVVKKRKGI